MKRYALLVALLFSAYGAAAAKLWDGIEKNTVEKLVDGNEFIYFMDPQSKGRMAYVDFRIDPYAFCEGTDWGGRKGWKLPSASQAREFMLSFEPRIFDAIYVAGHDGPCKKGYGCAEGRTTRAGHHNWHDDAGFVEAYQSASALACIRSKEFIEAERKAAAEAATKASSTSAESTKAAVRPASKASGPEVATVATGKTKVASEKSDKGSGPLVLNSTQSKTPANPDSKPAVAPPAPKELPVIAVTYYPFTLDRMYGNDFPAKSKDEALAAAREDRVKWEPKIMAVHWKWKAVSEAKPDCYQVTGGRVDGHMCKLKVTYEGESRLNLNDKTEAKGTTTSK